MNALKPTRKVTAATAAGAASTLIVWFLAEVGVDVPADAAAALATLLAFAGGWATRDPA